MPSGWGRLLNGPIALVTAWSTNVLLLSLARCTVCINSVSTQGNARHTSSLS